MNNKPPAEALKELQAESEKLGLYEDEAVEGKESRLMALGITYSYDDRTTWDWCVSYRLYGQVPIVQPCPTMESAWERAQEIITELKGE